MGVISSTRTQILIDSQQKEHSGEMFAIYDAVTKNLKTTDELFLSYIAKYIMQEQKVGCPYSAFTQNPKGSFKFKENGDEPFKKLDDSLSIAEARGIIEKVDPQTSNPVYTFCTVFYYNAFLGSAIADLHLEDKLFSQEDDDKRDFAADIEMVDNSVVIGSKGISYDELTNSKDGKRIIK